MSDAEKFDEDHVLAAEFTLRLLAGEELHEARRRLKTDFKFAAKVREWERQLAMLADDVKPETMSAGAKQALMNRLFSSTELAVSKPFLTVSFWRGLSFASMILAAALAYLLATNEIGESNALRVAEIASESGDFKFIAVLDQATQELLVTRVNGNAPAGRVLQVWAHGDDQPAISVGLFGDGETVRLTLPAELRNIRGTFTMGISEEPPGGSKTGSPSGQVLGGGEILGL